MKRTQQLIEEINREKEIRRRVKAEKQRRIDNLADKAKLNRKG